MKPRKRQRKKTWKRNLALKIFDILRVERNPFHACTMGEILNIMEDELERAEKIGILPKDFKITECWSI